MTDELNTNTKKIRRVRSGTLNKIHCFLSQTLNMGRRHRYQGVPKPGIARPSLFRETPRWILIESIAGDLGHGVDCTALQLRRRVSREAEWACGSGFVADIGQASPDS